MIDEPVFTRAVDLAEVLLPYRSEPVLDGYGGRWLDAPAPVVRAALALVEPTRYLRPNGQPPAYWLVDQATRFGGLLGGDVNVSVGFLRVDSI